MNWKVLQDAIIDDFAAMYTFLDPQDSIQTIIHISIVESMGLLQKAS